MAKGESTAAFKREAVRLARKKGAANTKIIAELGVHPNLLRRRSELPEPKTRFGIISLFDKTYLLRDGSGVGVGAPQYGERRTWFAALTHSF